MRLTVWKTLAAMVGAAVAARAGDGSWIGTADGNWSDTANWQDGVYASGAGSTAYFTNGVAVTVWQNVSGLTLGNLSFANASMLVTNLDLTLNGGGTSVITVNGSGVTANISAKMNPVAGTTLVKEGSGTFLLGQYLGLSGLTLNGGLTFLGFHDNSDGLNVGYGTITVNSGATLKTGGNNQINNYAVIDVKEGGVYDINGMTDNIGAITGDGIVSNAGVQMNFRLHGATQVFSGTVYGNTTYNFAEPGGTYAAGSTNAFANVWFWLYNDGQLGFAPGVGRFLLGGISTTNAQTVALQDTAGAPVILALGSRNVDMTPAVTFTGAGGLEKPGTATLTLTNAQTYTGSTLVSGGTLRLGDGANDGALSGTSDIMIGASGTLVFNTKADLTSGAALYGSGKLTKAQSSKVTLGAFDMTNAAVTVSGGTLALGGGSGSTGTTFTVNSACALEVNSGNLFGGTFALNTGSRIAFNGGSSTGAALNVSSGMAAPVALAGGNHIFSTPIGNNHTLFSQTGGTFGFNGTAGNNNTNDIFVTVSGGTLNIGSSTYPRGLGLLACSNAVVNLTYDGSYEQRLASDGRGHTIIVTNDAAVTAKGLQLMSPGASANTGRLDLAGGVFTTGDLNNNNGNDSNRVIVTFNGGLLRFSASTTIGANRSSTFRVLEGGARIDGGSLQTQINQPLENGTGGVDGGLTKYGTSVLVLSTNALYAGPTTVKVGTLRTSSVGGSAFGGGSVLLDGGTLQAYPAGSGLTVSLAAADGAAADTFTFGAGPSAVGFSKGGDSSVALTLGNVGAVADSVLVRTNSGVLAVIPGNGTATSNLGANEKLLVNGGVAMVNGMVPAVIGVHNDDRRSIDFLIYDPTAGFEVATYTAGLDGGATSLANVTASMSTDSKSVAALRVHNGATLTVNSGQTVTVGDGVNPAGVIINNSSSATAGITGGTLDFGASEGVVSFNLRRSNVYGPTLNSVITGLNGLTLAGGGSDQDLTLGAANTYEGPTRLMAGCVTPANAQGFSSGDVYVYGNEGGGGQFKFAFAGTVTNAFHLAGVGGTPSGVPAGAVRFDANGTVTGPVELMSDARIGAPTAAAVGTLSGVIYGPYGLEIGCPGQIGGKVRLGGANTYGGITRISGGTLEIDDGGMLGTGAIVNNSMLVFNVSGDVTVTNPISGSGRVVQKGSGTLTLSGANALAGSTDVSAGTLVLDTSISSSNVVSVSGVLDLDGQDLSIGRLSGSGVVSNSVGGAVILTVGAGNADGFFWGAIAGTTSLNKTGSGTLALSGVSTYSGATVVGAGTLKLQSVPDAPLSAGLAYRLDASDSSSLTLDGSNVTAWTDTAGAGVAFTQTLSHLEPVYITNAINGLAAVRFNGWMTNRMVAAKTVNAQTVFIVNNMTGYQNLAGIWGRAGNDTGIRAGSATSWQLGGDGNDFTYGGQMFINGEETSSFTASAPHLLTAVSGAQRAGWSTAIGDYWGSAANRRSYIGDIGEILVYDSALSTADRQMTEVYLEHKWLGFVAAVPTNVLPTATALMISNSAAFDLNGSSQEVGSLSGAGSVINSSAAWSVLTVGNSGSDTLFSGVIAGSNALVKAGSGTLTLSGASTYLGDTTVSAGMLLLDDGANRLPVGTTVTVASGATLDLNGQSQTLYGLGGSGDVLGGDLLAVTGVVSPGGDGTVGTLTITGSPALAGTLLIDTRTGGACDLLSVDGDLDLSALALRIADTAQMGGASYVMAECTGLLTGSFTSDNLPKSWTLRYDRTSGAGSVELIHALGTMVLVK